MNVGNPETAFAFGQLPNEGIGLARLEFDTWQISRATLVHPIPSVVWLILRVTVTDGHGWSWIVTDNLRLHHLTANLYKSDENPQKNHQINHHNIRLSDNLDSPNLIKIIREIISGDVSSTFGP